MDSAEWFLLYAKPRQEAVAQTHLDRQGYQTYLPLISERRFIRGRWRRIVEPMFSRYLFIRLDASRDNWAPIRSTVGVSGLVRFGTSPARVPISLVRELQSRAESDGVFRPRDHQWVKGERVQIVDGPLAGYEAAYEARTGAERVKVLMDVVGHYTVVELSEHQLARAV